MSTIVTATQLTDKEKDEILKQLLGQDYYTAGKNLPLLQKIIGVISDTNDIATLAEIIPIINTALANSRLFAIVSSGASVFSILLFPVGSMISIINAYQLGIKMYSYRAIAYSITALTYNKPIPTSSKKIISNSKTTFPTSSNSEIMEKHNTWKKTSLSVLKEIDQYLLSNRIPKDIFKILLQAISDGSEQKLCELLLKGYEKEFKDYHSKAVWKNNYSIKYPQ